MTVPIEYDGISQYTGDGSTTYFEFGFPVEGAGIFVTVDGEVVGYSIGITGITFDEAPAAGAVILLVRLTNVTQERNWYPFGPFPASKTELAVDKLILLKQETLNYRAKMNLTRVRFNDRIELVNDKGDNAILYLWGSDKAGLFSGSVSRSIPPDGSYPPDPVGYVYFKFGNPAPPVVNTSQLSSLPYPLLVSDDLDPQTPSLLDMSIRTYRSELDPQPPTLQDITLTTVIAYTFEQALDELDPQPPTLEDITLTTVIEYTFLQPIPSELDPQPPELLDITLTATIEFVTHGQTDSLDPQPPTLEDITLTTV